MDGHTVDMEQEILLLKQKVTELEAQNNLFKSNYNVLLKTVRDIYEVNNSMMQEFSEMSKNVMEMTLNHAAIEVQCENVSYEVFDGLMNQKTYFFPIIKSSDETIEEIIRNKKSMARFGDGEFSQIVKLDRQKFQRMDDKLGIRLEEVLHSNHPDVLIAIANNYGNLDTYTDFARFGIRDYMSGGNMRKLICNDFCQ